MAQFTVPALTDTGVAEDSVATTIGEALELAALSPAGDKLVRLANAAAIRTAEMRTTGLPGVVPGGVAAAALKAAEMNMNPETTEEGKVRLKYVVRHAAAVLPANEAVRSKDAEVVAAAAARNGKEGVVDKEEGVPAAVAAAARLNEGRML